MYDKTAFFKDQAERIAPDIEESFRRDGITPGQSIGPFLARQLESIDKRIMEVIERELKFGQFMSINTSEVAPGSASYTWEQEDHSGLWRKVGAQGKDLPTTDSSVEDFNYKNTHYGSSYELTTQEIRAAILANRPLPQRKADAVRRAYNEARQSLAMFGDADTNKTGFINDANITPVVAANGAAASPLWANKTGEEIYNDVVTAYNAVRNASLDTAIPNILALPIAQANLLDTNLLNSAGNVGATVGEVIRRNLGLTVISTPELSDSVTVSGSDYNQMIVYESSPMWIEFMQGLDITMRAGQWNGLTWTVPFEAELVGCVIRKPVAFASIYGI